MSNEEISPDLLASPIEILELRARLVNCLKVEYIYYVGELIQRTETDLRRMTIKLRTKNINEIKSALALRGLMFGTRLEWWQPPSPPKD